MTSLINICVQRVCTVENAAKKSGSPDQTKMVIITTAPGMNWLERVDAVPTMVKGEGYIP